MKYGTLTETLRLYPPSSEPGRDSLQSVATQRDGNGNPAQVTEQYSGAIGTRQTAKTYDSFDRLETVTDPQGKRLAYTYDANGNRKTLADPDGLTTRYDYDALNRVASVTVTGAGVQEAWWKRSENQYSAMVAIDCRESRLSVFRREMGSADYDKNRSATAIRPRSPSSTAAPSAPG